MADQHLCHLFLQGGQCLRIPFRRAAVVLRAAQRKEQNVIVWRIEFYLQGLRSFGNLRNAQPSGNNLLKKAPAGEHLIFLRLALEHREILPLLLLGLHLLLERNQQLYEFFFDDGFEQILLHPHTNRLLCIGKIVISADNDNFGAGQFLSDQLAQRESVHKRHLDVGD
ncbi:hypothetical protein SDC9_113049 [bioreactor metagenome]|uniref:Uncharacterized protein n=1 Tax=bioreactor metagenome TaxID=1076179 RepID=A0A645BLS7_9ZZZZ